MWDRREWEVIVHEPIHTLQDATYLSNEFFEVFKYCDIELRWLIESGKHICLALLLVPDFTRSERGLDGSQGSPQCSTVPRLQVCAWFWLACREIVEVNYTCYERLVKLANVPTAVNSHYTRDVFNLNRNSSSSSQWAPFQGGDWRAARSTPGLSSEATPTAWQAGARPAAWCLPLLAKKTALRQGSMSYWVGIGQEWRESHRYNIYYDMYNKMSMSAYSQNSTIK